MVSTFRNEDSYEFTVWSPSSRHRQKKGSGDRLKRRLSLVAFHGEFRSFNYVAWQSDGNASRVASLLWSRGGCSRHDKQLVADLPEHVRLKVPMSMSLVSASSVDSSVSGPNQIAIVRCACQLPLFDLCVTFDVHVNCLFCVRSPECFDASCSTNS